MPGPDVPPHDACEAACDEVLPPSRRAFLRGAGAALGAMALLGLTTEEALAVPLHLMRGTRGEGGTVRYPIPAGDAVIFDDQNEVILVRRGAQAWAFVSACPHKEVVKLKWLKAENRFQCPKHDSKYQPDGTFIDGKATRNMDRLPIRKEGSELVVDPERAWQSDTQGPGWAGAVAAV